MGVACMWPGHGEKPGSTWLWVGGRGLGGRTTPEGCRQELGKQVRGHRGQPGQARPPRPLPLGISEAMVGSEWEGWELKRGQMLWQPPSCPACSSLSLSFCLCLCPSISVYLYLYLFPSVSLSLTISVSVSPSVSLVSVSLHLSVAVSVSVQWPPPRLPACLRKQMSLNAKLTLCFQPPPVYSFPCPGGKGLVPEHTLHSL